jgi:anti-anti-sigma factor
MEGIMKIIASDPSKRKVITIRVDEQLDFSAHRAFSHACEELAAYPDTRKIIIDLSKTRRVFDSGLAMLLMLRDRAGRLKGRIMLANCGPEIREQLATGKFGAQFHIA